MAYRLMQRRVWLGLRNSVRSAALNAMKSPTWWPSVCAIVTRSPARIRQRRAWPAGMTSSRRSVLMTLSSVPCSLSPLYGGHCWRRLGGRCRTRLRNDGRRVGPQQAPQEGARPILLRPAEDLVRMALLDDTAAIHEDDPVADFPREVELVGHDDHGHARARQAAHGLEDLVDELRVERGGGLVEQHQRRIHGERAGDGHPLLLPPGKLRRQLAGVLGQAQPLEQ